MLATQQRNLGDNLGSRSGWPHPEESCGPFVTKLPRGKAAWLVIGPAAEAWKSLSPRIREVAQREEFRMLGVSFFAYMIGREKASASPSIIFCSSDVAGRKLLRNAVRETDILKDYPSIALGDSSSPLARNNNGLQAQLPYIPQQLRVGRSRRFSDDTVPDQESRPQNWKAYQLGTVNEDFGRLVIHDSPSLSSVGSSAFNAASRSIISTSAYAPSSRSSVADSIHQVEVGISPVKSKTNKDWVNPEENTNPGDFDEFSETDESESAEPTDIRVTYHLAYTILIDALLKAHEAYKSSQRSTESRNHQSAPTCQVKEGIQQAQNPVSISQTPRQSATEPSASTNKQTQKRTRQDLEDPLDTGTAEPRTAVKKQKGISIKEKLFACPYWKKDPQRFRECYKYQLKEIKNVKQHLCRRHKKPLRCPRCQTVLAPNEQYHHSRYARCDIEQEVDDEGIADEQVQKFHEKGSSRLTPPERWYIVWDIVFPNDPRPSSPYQDDDLSRDLCEFREFFTSRGATVLLDHIRTNPAWTIEDEARLNTDSAMNQVLNDALEQIYALWMVQREDRHSESSPQTPTQQELIMAQRDNSIINLSPSPDRVDPIVDDGNAYPAELSSPFNQIASPIPGEEDWGSFALDTTDVPGLTTQLDFPDP